MKRIHRVRFASAITTALLLASCAGPGPTSFEQSAAENTLPSTSYDTFARVEPKLKGLRAGDPITRESLGLQTFIQSKGLSGETRYFSVGDGWMPSMSAGGLFALGRAFGLEGNTIYGRHVFGYVYGNATLVPKYELRTKASIVPDAEYQEMKRQGRDDAMRDVSFGTGGKVYYFNDDNVTVDALRPLPFQGLPEIDKEELTVKEVAPGKLLEDLRAVYTKASFEEAEAQLQRMQAGTDTWDMVHQLNGIFLTKDYGQIYVLFMKGYANYDADSRWQVATERGVYEIWPFGYVQGDKQVMKLSVIFRNGKFERIAPYEAEAILAPRLRDQP